MKKILLIQLKLGIEGVIAGKSQSTINTQTRWFSQEIMRIIDLEDRSAELKGQVIGLREEEKESMEEGQYYLHLSI